MHLLPVSLFSLLLLAPAIDGWLGIYLDPDNEQAIVAEVIPDSPAAKAGLQAGDELLAVGDKATATREAFVAAIRAGKSGDRMSIKLRREGKESIVVVKLGERPASADAGEAEESERPAKPERTKPSAPVAEAKPRSEEVVATPKRPYLGLSVRETGEGVVVDRVLPDGPAKALSAGEGTVITSLGGQSVKTLADLDHFLQASQPGQKVAVGLRDGKGVRSVTIALGEQPGSAKGSGEVTVAPIAVAPSRVEPLHPPAAEPKAKQLLRHEEGGRSAGGQEPAAKPVDLEQELAALRAELADLRRQLEELRKNKGRE